MSLLAGTTLSHYKVLGEIGRGGMGIVYRARDLTLDREVALKVLPPERVTDPERKRRFVLEAKAAARLEHPYIGVVHEIGEVDGATFIAMELIRGEALSRMVDAGRLSLARALGLATEIAEGLARAHGSGIVHRDLKPANVMVTEDGHAKIIDFGLAKLVEDAAGADSEANTDTASGTDTGAVLGTAAYMSPEQARGQAVDHRSDVFSFGAMLHEMLTGRRPFRGATRVDTLHAILNSPAPPLELPSGEDTADLQRIVDKCLAKDSAERYQGTRDLAVDLQAARRRLESGSTPLVSSSPATHPPLRRPWLVVVTMALLGAAVAIAVRSGVHASRARWARNVALPEIVRLAKDDRLQAALGMARQATAYLPDDPQLQQQIKDMTHVTSIASEPSGAQVFFADYLDPKAEWERLGTTPIAEARVPYGVLRWRVVRDGYDESVTPAAAEGPSLSFGLVAEGTAPPGMAAIPAGHQNWSAENSFDLPAYWLDRYEVTNTDFKRFVDAGGYRKREYWKEPFLKDGRVLSWDEAMASFHDQTGRPGPATWKLGSFPEGQGDHPVGGVSWYEASAFAAFAGKSLPTVHHWGHALQGDVSRMLRLSNFGGDGPQAVGRSRALGPFGTYDMAGNIEEWTATTFRKGPARILMGGAWNDPVYLFENGDPASPLERHPTFGFRCALYTSPPSPEVFGPFVWREPIWGQPAGDETFNVYRSLYAYERRDLQVVVEGTEEATYSRREIVSYDAGYAGERVLAHLFLPRQPKPPYQTVIYFPEAWAFVLKSSRDMEMRWVGFIVRSGRAVLCPVFKGTYERRVEGVDDWPAAQEWAIDWAKDLGRSIDYLETRKDIDASRIAYYGFSMGAQEGPILGAVEPRLKTLILLSGGLLSGGVPPQVDPLHFAPRTRVPVLMLNGKNDLLLSKGSMRLFELLGTPPENKRRVLLEGRHIPSRLEDVIREVLDWLDRALGPVSGGEGTGP